MSRRPRYRLNADRFWTSLWTVTAVVVAILLWGGWIR